eukprot:TRINITY_DN28155_c0_g1_i1.p1 TRINITY_DN28155_c0_g1~~TRINITY_DN28155_c0_g1_i1.p1  ORF type:complete len:190 (+),score=27.45 TRINITY_DN28155_c0_g1_i1:128-697(+)
MAKEANPILCCTGSYGGAVTLVLFFAELIAVLFTRADGNFAVFRLVRLLQLGSLCTAPLGMIVLHGEKKRRRVPRGCDCCCSCPWPPWSLFFQLLDLFGIMEVVYDPGIETIVGFLIILVCVILDIVFATMWLMALHKQDGDLCCGQSKADAPLPAVVVGRPVVVENEAVVTGVPTEEDEKAQDPNLTN